MKPNKQYTLEETIPTDIKLYNLVQIDDKALLFSNENNLYELKGNEIIIVNEASEEDEDEIEHLKYLGNNQLLTINSNCEITKWDIKFE